MARLWAADGSHVTPASAVHVDWIDQLMMIWLGVSCLVLSALEALKGSNYRKGSPTDRK